MYKRIHTPNSPLLPLSPLVQTSEKVFLSPKDARFHGKLRRSFTPSTASKFCFSPPSISPIRNNTQITGSNIAFNENIKKVDFLTPSKILNFCSVSKSAHASIKQLRSSARKDNMQTHQHKLLPLRRSLFVTETPPIIEINSPKTPNEVVATFSNLNQNHSDTPRILLTPAQKREMIDDLQSLNLNEYDGTPNILEQTFTVNSILKEINMKKYADLFAREEIDLFVFSMLSIDDLIELGIDKEDRSILMAAVQTYKELFGNIENNNN